MTTTSPKDGILRHAAFYSLQNLFGARRAAALSKEAHEQRLPGESVFSAYVRHAGIKVSAKGLDLATLPRSGPVLFVSNHPTHWGDAHFLGSIIDTEIRPDAKFLSASAVCALPDVGARSIAIAVPSPLGRVPPDADQRNAAAREAAHAHLESGGAVVIFPSGGAIKRGSSGDLEDGEWRHGAFALAAKSGAKVVPVYINAAPSRLRRALYRIHPVLFSSAIVNEVLSRRGETIDITFGDPDSQELKDALADLSAAPEKVRGLVYRLRA